jgi:hypothetical protein
VNSVSFTPMRSKVQAGDFFVEAHQRSGAPVSPLCYFDDKSTRHIVQVLACATSATPSKIKSLKNDV